MITIRTLEKIYSDILNDYATELNVNVNELDVSIKVEAKVFAGFLYIQELKLSRQQNNLYADISEREELEREGFLLLSRYPKQATAGLYLAQVVGTNGQIIPENTQFIGDDNITAKGKVFVNDAEFIYSSGNTKIQIRSLDLGKNAGLKVGDVLTSIQPLETNNKITVTSILEYPTNAENIEEYRKDVLDAKRIVNNSDSPYAYRLWCAQIGEIRNIYPYRNKGTLEIYVEATKEAAIDQYFRPSQAVLDQVYKVDSSGTETGVVVYDETLGLSRRSVMVTNIESKAVKYTPVIVRVVGLSDVSYLNQIKTAVYNYLYEKRPFIAGAESLSNKNDTITKAEVITVVSTLLNSTTVTYNNIILYVGIQSDVENYKLKNGYIPYLEDVVS
jgi:hypothetical protein